MILVNVSACLFNFFEGMWSLKNYDFSFQSVFYVQIFSCLTLFDGCRRLYFFLNENTVNGINNKAVSFHILVYVIYLSGILYFYLTTVKHVDS